VNEAGIARQQSTWTLVRPGIFPGGEEEGKVELSEKDRKFVVALARGLEVLSCFHAGDYFLGNNQIAERTGLAKSTVSRLTYTLTEVGYLRFDPSLNKYRLGTAVLSLSYSLLGQMDVRRIARPLMQALAEHTQAAVNLGVRDRLSMVYIDTYRNASTYAVQLDVGSQIALATSSMGRAYLAALPEAERLAVMEEIRASDEQNWPRIKQGDRAGGPGLPGEGILPVAGGLAQGGSCHRHPLRSRGRLGDHGLQLQRGLLPAAPAGHRRGYRAAVAQFGRERKDGPQPPVDRQPNAKIFLTHK